ncbi:DHH family phosphoesterase [Sporolactobacillus shoreicorticis]|uniref:Cyclic-di-AMP phosphodiesterase n=1 Tax=Sporolactobacillus shoreicorticis TaxID=1923877 RepID=A0ABW5S9Z8_9BACL|nr:DHH family phosphoesterase [Sporolactobacillus shoreicorticis]MCO7126079.1 DHH family phosphoesterase [Sporolactobacillus shoreicorticis]
MANQFKHRWRSDLLIVIGLLFLLFLVFVAFLNWLLAVAGLVLLALSVLWFLINERQFDKELIQYAAGMSYRLKKVGNEALLHMPIGILLYDESERVQWCNPYLNQITEEDGNTAIGRSLNEIAESLSKLIASDNKESMIIALNDRQYRVRLKRQEKLLYFTDITDTLEIKKRYYNEKTVLALIFLDNYDEVTQGLEDQVRSTINNETTTIIKNWASEHGIYLRRTDSDRFLAIMNERLLHSVEEQHFSILDKVREITVPLSHIPLTLSIGVGAGTASLEDLGSYAQSALDLGLGRGGDQAVIKRPDGDVRFYGGKSNPVEKRTRVRARVISHALSELMLESDQVMIMGHRAPDLDSIGSCIGILKIAHANGRSAKIIMDQTNNVSGVSKLLEELKKQKNLWSNFISAEQAADQVTKRTLMVIVDTHRPSMVVNASLLASVHRIVVIDHHRRAEEFIRDPVLVYMEPYASSTSELVTELLEYQPNERPLDLIEATAMLGGIAVDTKNFTLRTGFRTFDAASYLRAHGADTILVQKFLCDDLDQFNQRAELIRRTKLYKANIAIAVGKDEQIYDQVLLAQTADTMLMLEGIRTSFVIGKRTDGQIGVSARSLGDLNVQVIMESIGGGGHLNNAATQMADTSIEEATARVTHVIDLYLEGGLS